MVLGLGPSETFVPTFQDRVFRVVQKENYRGLEQQDAVMVGLVDFLLHPYHMDPFLVHPAVELVYLVLLFRLTKNNIFIL
jgi:hypothetical protein